MTEPLRFASLLDILAEAALALLREPTSDNYAETIENPTVPEEVQPS